MSHPLSWPFKYYFYPIGNTSAICLTQDLPVEQAADVLLLGCGDARNVLYTIYADLRSRADGARRLDFTCCDIEPAILARNILLYTLVGSGKPLDDVWNIFYHFYLDDRSYQLLESHCRLLASASESMQSWQKSEFGAYLKMCNSHTLAEMHRHWKLYAAFSTIPRARLDHLHAEQKKLTKEVLGKWKVILSQYWRTGTTFSAAQDIASARKLNPSFVYNIYGETFVPHYGTFPPQTFHLTQPSLLFSAMAKALKPLPLWTSLIIRFCVGDVLSFCKALDSNSQGIPARLFTSAFSGHALELDGQSPSHAFDVIDTSNLMDHIGLINLLATTKPLLKSLSTSVLYTETLLPDREDATAALLGRLCGDVSTISLLVGLAPRTYLSGFNTHSNVHELLFNAEASKQFHERIAWCSPSASDAQGCHDQPVVFDSAELGAVLYNVYDQMCADEKIVEALRNPGLRSLHKVMAQQHHDRASFAQLVRLATSRVVPGVGGWETAFDVLHRLVQEDRTRLVNLNNYQDFCLQLHLHGVATTTPLSPMWRSVVAKGDLEVFRGWDDIPPVVCVLLTVPQRRLKIFDDTKNLGSMPLLCHLLSSLDHDNVFACNMHAMPGRVERSPNSPSAAVVVPDERDVKDAPSLVLSFLVPAWLLTLPGTKVMFAFKATPPVTFCLQPKLGPFLEIFSAPLTDKTHVCVTKQRPGTFTDPRASEVLRQVPHARAPSVNRVTIKMDDTFKCIAAMTLKLDLAAIGFSAPVAPSLPITAKQTAACTIEVAVGDQRGYAQFPFPVRGSEHRLRVARKSLYVEVIVPPFYPPKGTSQTLPGNIFPIIKTGGLTPWNVHHVNLDIAPAIDLNKKIDPDWVALHATLQFSERELDIAQKLDPSSIPASSALVGLKQSIQDMIKVFSSPIHTGSRVRIFRLVQQDTREIVLLIFVHHLRLDLPSFTLLMDAAVVPLDEAISAAHNETIRLLPKSPVIPTIPITPAEAVAWKQLLPAVVERCRAWAHGPNCEYASSGRIPVSVEPGAIPLCGCGRGFGIPDVMPDVPVEVWRALRPLATRAAISPLFAVSYLEPVIAVGKAARARVTEVRARAGSVASKMQDVASGDGEGAPAGAAAERCIACGGPGKPKLLLCGKCKRAKYCSPACNRTDWKTHKLICRPV
ncbi:uncharacterized protein B0H18DRAFT_1118073 [Fomitopsis serialis]|uniref:uncharacterized protein n=1 Tax=Fomitopsis serialis TaxID=139415 RepID=UPI0020081F7F|nr:uncharacterized protein B0H18DRAFT_1118073 [Neoantrodia serialis]KAH9928407.1 hypothetical protein B0H18DRAFT_1118073 [Neoantrodia serialis]